MCLFHPYRLQSSCTLRIATMVTYQTTSNSGIGLGLIPLLLSSSSNLPLVTSAHSLSQLFITLFVVVFHCNLFFPLSAIAILHSACGLSLSFCLFAFYRYYTEAQFLRLIAALAAKGASICIAHSGARQHNQRTFIGFFEISIPAEYSRHAQIVEIPNIASSHPHNDLAVRLIDCCRPPCPPHIVPVVARNAFRYGLKVTFKTLLLSLVYNGIGPPCGSPAGCNRQYSIMQPALHVPLLRTDVAGRRRLFGLNASKPNRPR